MTEEFEKKYRYRKVQVKCCATCGHHWYKTYFGIIMCDGSFTKEGTSQMVAANGYCNRYYPEKTEEEK
jgi:hypothetical protein